MGARKAAAKPAAPPVDQPAAIPERGEHELVLEGVTYRLRPSFLAVRTIEKKTKPLIELVQAGDRGGLTLEEMGIIAAELIKAGAEDEATRHVGADRIAELIYEEGVPAAMGRLTMCLLDAMTGGRTASGEARAATA